MTASFPGTKAAVSEPVPYRDLDCKTRLIAIRASKSKWQRVLQLSVAYAEDAHTLQAWLGVEKHGRAWTPRARLPRSPALPALPPWGSAAAGSLRWSCLHS